MPDTRTDYSYLNKSDKGPLDYRDVFKEPPIESYYDCPIHEQIGELKTMMANEHDKMVIKAVQEVGIEIDQKSLVEAIHSDRKRYEEAYRKGYEDASKKYQERLKKAAFILQGIGIEMPEGDE